MNEYTINIDRFIVGVMKERKRQNKKTKEKILTKWKCLIFTHSCIPNIAQLCCLLCYNNFFCAKDAMSLSAVLNIQCSYKLWYNIWMQSNHIGINTKESDWMEKQKPHNKNIWICTKEANYFKSVWCVYICVQ